MTTLYLYIFCRVVKVRNLGGGGEILKVKTNSIGKTNIFNCGDEVRAISVWTTFNFSPGTHLFRSFRSPSSPSPSRRGLLVGPLRPRAVHPHHPAAVPLRLLGAHEGAVGLLGEDLQGLLVRLGGLGRGGLVGGGRVALKIKKKMAKLNMWFHIDGCRNMKEGIDCKYLS